MSLDLPLSFLERPAAVGTAQPWLLILLHGIGSNEPDLFGLAPHVPPPFHVLSLRAPTPWGLTPMAGSRFLSGGRRPLIDAEQEATSRSVAAQPSRRPASNWRSRPSGRWSAASARAASCRCHCADRPDLKVAAMVMHSSLLPEVLPMVAPIAEADRSAVVGEPWDRRRRHSAGQRPRHPGSGCPVVDRPALRRIPGRSRDSARGVTGCDAMAGRDTDSGGSAGVKLALRCNPC